MGSLFRSPKQPEPPPAVPDRDYTDLINKVQKKTITRPDGTKEDIIESLPLTAEEQALVTQLDGLVKSNLGIFERYTAQAAAIDIPELRPAVQALQEQQRIARETSFAETSRATEDELARRGLSDSTAAVQTRSSLQSAFNEQVQSDTLQARMLAEDLRAQRLAEAVQGFSLASGQLESMRGSKTQAAQFGVQATTALQQAQNAAANQRFALQVDAFKSRPPSPFQQLLSAGTAFGSAYLLGGGLNSLFGGAGAGAAAAPTKSALAPTGAASGSDLFSGFNVRTRF